MSSFRSVQSPRAGDWLVYRAEPRRRPARAGDWQPAFAAAPLGRGSLRVRATGWFTEPNLAEGGRRLVIDSPPSRLRRFGAAASRAGDSLVYRRLAGLPSRSS